MLLRRVFARRRLSWMAFNGVENPGFFTALHDGRIDIFLGFFFSFFSLSPHPPDSPDFPPDLPPHLHPKNGRRVEERSGTSLK